MMSHIAVSIEGGPRLAVEKAPRRMGFGSPQLSGVAGLAGLYRVVAGLGVYGLMTCRSGMARRSRGLDESGGEAPRQGA